MVSALRRMIEESHTLTVEAAVNQEKDGSFFFPSPNPHAAVCFAAHGALGLPSLSSLESALFSRVKWV